MRLSRKAKKDIIILICLIALMMAIVIGIVIGFFVYNSSNMDNEQGTSELNTLYRSEMQNNEEENTMVVPLDNITLQNEENTNEGENNNTIREPQNVNAPYYIKVNNQANVVTVYKKDNNGAYTVPIKTMICSIGTATPESGVYTISDKYTWRLLERRRVWAVCL